MARKIDGIWFADKVEKSFGIEICIACGKQILAMAFKGTGVCCENCRKVRDGEGRSNYGT